MPSLIYPVYVIAGVLMVAIGAVLDWRQGEFFAVPASLLMLCLPAVLLAIKTA